MTNYVWPTDLVAYRCEFYLRDNNSVLESPITRTRQVLARQGARWVATLGFRLKREKWQKLDALFGKLRGSYNTVSVWDMSQREPLGTNLDLTSIGTSYFNTPGSPGGRSYFTTGSPAVLTGFRGGAAGITVYGAHALGVREVLVRGFPQSTTQLLAGDYVEMNGRLYKLTEDATANALSRATLYLNRGLVAALTNGMAVTRTRARTPMTLIDDDQPRGAVDFNGVKEYSITLVEALEEV